MKKEIRRNWQTQKWPQKDSEYNNPTIVTKTSYS